MTDTSGEHPDPQLSFLHELLDEHAAIAGDIAEIDPHTWAIHGVIPVDGEVVMAEYPTYDEARVVLDSLRADNSGETAP